MLFWLSSPIAKWLFLVELNELVFGGSTFAHCFAIAARCGTNLLRWQSEGTSDA
jgi:hypothetical protein